MKENLLLDDDASVRLVREEETPSPAEDFTLQNEGYKRKLFSKHDQIQIVFGSYSLLGSSQLDRT